MLYQFSTITFKKQKESEYILTHSAFSINLISRIEQDTTKRENLRPISLMNTDEKNPR